MNGTINLSDNKVALTFTGLSIDQAGELTKYASTLITTGTKRVESVSTTDEETTTTTTKKAKKKTGPTLEDVVEALRTYAESESREEAIKIMKKTAGVTTVAKLDEDQYQDVIDALAID